MNFTPGAFQTGLCDCFLDCSSCFEGWFCLHCQVARQRHMALTGRSDPNYGTCALLCCIDSCMLGGCAVMIATAITRAEIKSKYQIAEGDFESWMIGFCCPMLSTCQTYREQSIRGQWPGGCCASAPFVHAAIPTQAPPVLAAPLVPVMVAAPVQVGYGYGYAASPGYVSVGGVPIAGATQVPVAINQYGQTTSVVSAGGVPLMTTTTAAPPLYYNHPPQPSVYSPKSVP